MGGSQYWTRSKFHISTSLISTNPSFKLISRLMTSSSPTCLHLRLDSSIWTSRGFPWSWNWPSQISGAMLNTLDGVIASIFPLYGEGPMWLELYDLILHAKAAVTINAEGYIQVTELDLTADFNSIKLHLDNLMGGGNFGEAINNLLNALGGYIWDQLKGFLFPFLDDVLTKILNDALSSCSIVDLIQDGSCFQQKLAESLQMGRSTFPLFGR